MSPVVSLSTDLLQEIRTNLHEAEKALTTHIQFLLSTFKKNDENYSKAFLKHIGHDAKLCGAYDLLCDLRRNAINDNESDILNALNTQSDAIRHCLTKFNDIIINSTNSNEPVVVSSIKVEPDEDLDECDRSTVNCDVSDDGENIRNEIVHQSEMSTHNLNSAGSEPHHTPQTASTSGPSITIPAALPVEKVNCVIQLDDSVAASNPCFVSRDGHSTVLNDGIVHQSEMCTINVDTDAIAPSRRAETKSISGPDAKHDDHGSSTLSKRQRVNVERSSRDGERRKSSDEQRRDRRERRKSRDRRDHTERDRDDRSRSRGYRGSRGRSRSGDRSRSLKDYGFELYREDMKLIAKRHREFHLSSFDHKYIHHFKRSIRSFYSGKLKDFVTYFAEYFKVEQIQSINQCNVVSLLYQSNRRRDAPRKSTYFTSPRRRQRDRSRSPYSRKR